MSTLNLLPETKARLPEYDLETDQLAFEDLAPVLMERILESGTRKEVRWLFSKCKEKDIIRFIIKHGERRLSRPNQIFWRTFFQLESPKRKANPSWTPK